MVSLGRALRIGALAAGVAVGSPAPAAAQNPCPDATTQAALRGAVAPFGPGKDAGRVDNGGRWGVLDSVWNHRSARERGLLRPLAAADATGAEDIGEIAVLRDEGDLFRAANIYDLRDVTLRFHPNRAGGYDVTHRGAAAWRAPVGRRLALGDDDSTRLNLPFRFAYYAAAHSRAFVNSDGNVTFEEADAASTPRNVSRLLSGPPRIAPFLADLDPSSGGGVFARTERDAVTVNLVLGGRAFGSRVTTTVQGHPAAERRRRDGVRRRHRTRGGRRRAVSGPHHLVRVDRLERDRRGYRRPGGRRPRRSRRAVRAAGRAGHGRRGPEVPPIAPGRLRPGHHLDGSADPLRGFRLRDHDRERHSGDRPCRPTRSRPTSAATN